jgi:hypothetical protein
MGNYLPYVFLFGLVVAILGAIGLIVAAFREGIFWGMAVLVFPPLALIFGARHPRRAVVPACVLLAGLLISGTTPLVNRLAAVDLGPREKFVDGELHLTLTGWDRDDYSLLQSKPDAVVVQMANSDVDDSTLKYLAGMAKLRELDLNGSKVSDDGLRSIETLPSLETLRLRDTPVTDLGFKRSLCPMARLKQLDLRGTRVSREAIDAWKKDKPGRRALL